VVGGGDVNVKIDPRNGQLAASDAAFAFAPSDVHAGEVPTVHGIAFTGRSVPSGPSKAYVLERRTAIVARLGSSAEAPDEARTGRLYTVGSLEVPDVASLPSNLGFVATGDTTAYAALHSGSPVTSLFHVDLVTGGAEPVGAIGTSDAVRGLTVQPAANPPRMDVTRVRGALNFRRSIRDSITIRGDVPVPSGDLEGKTVVVDVDGLAKTFVLNAKGKGRLDDDSVKIGGVAPRGVRLKIRFVREDLVSVLSDEGMDGTVFARRAPKQVVVTVTIDTQTYRMPVDVFYSAYPGRTGTLTTE
jgi:uncharacterized protein DUF4394